MKVVFCGASGEIGASCILVRLDGKNILMDSGIRMNNDPLPEFRTIQENGGIDCILVSHAHMDHTGSLPVISREYPNAPLYMTHPTRDITKVLLYDSLKIMKHRDGEIPVFAENDVLEMLSRIKTYSFQFTFQPFADENLTVTFYSAGHIAGASCIFIQGKEGSVFYTGDYSVTPQKTVGGVSFPRLSPDVVITESTYGDKLHTNRKTEEEKLIDTVKKVVERGGKILIPAFAVGRAQEVILILKSAMNRKQLPKIPVYVDGMVKDICAVYKNSPNYLKDELAKRIWHEKSLFYNDQIQPVISQEMRSKITEKDEPCCIISSSGMLTGGFSVYYAEALAKSEKNYIAITGYQDEESPGRGLLELAEQPAGEKRVWKIGERNISLLCEFNKYSLSAHADKSEIMGLIEKLQPRKLFLIHGNPEVLNSLGMELQKQKTERRREIYIPKNGEEFEISFHNPRKQLNTLKIETLNKNEWPEKENLSDLYNYLKNQDRKYGYSVEELIYLWSGKKDFDESLVFNFQELLNESIYFEPVERKLFLYKPVDEFVYEKGEEAMEANQMLTQAEMIFPPESGLYKKGFRTEEKVAILSFNFPAVIQKKYSDLIRQFEEITGWKAEINNNPNLNALEAHLRFLLKGQEIIKSSFYREHNTMKIKLDEKPGSSETEHLFEEHTGVKLECNYPGKETKIETVPKNLNRMDQHSATTFIKNVFSESDDRLYRTSIKNDSDQYIELSFISPEIGNKYLTWIEDLKSETGWDIRISKTSNQIEIINKLLSILSKEQIFPKKNPSVIEAQKIVKLKLSEPLENMIWENISMLFEKGTGFKLEYQIN